MRLHLIVAAVLSVPAAASAQQTLELPSPARSLEFNINNIEGLNVSGSARGIPGLDYSAGASVTSPPSGPVIHRIILDRTHHTFFGYDLVLERVAAGARIHLHFAPLSDIRGFNFDKEHFHPADMATPRDVTLDFAEPTEVPLETDAAGHTTLRDKLMISRAQ